MREDLSAGFVLFPLFALPVNFRIERVVALRANDESLFPEGSVIWFGLNGFAATMASLGPFHVLLFWEVKIYDLLPASAALKWQVKSPANGTEPNPK